LRAAQQDAPSQQIVQGYLDSLVAKTGWQPTLAASFAGAVKYREYNFLVRQLMKRIAKQAGLSTDTSQNHVYTDWDAVTAFAKDFETLLSQRAAS
jgi:menaquinone-dependent protoporphyrinogen oxidase